MISGETSFGQDLRVCRYFRPVRIVDSAGCKNLERLLEADTVQGFVDSNGDFCRIAPGGWVILDYGAELAGGVRLVSGGAAAKLRLRFGESVSECCHAPNNDHSLHDFAFELPMWGANTFGDTGFRFVRIDAEGELQLAAAPSVRRMREATRSGDFACSDDRLNAVYSAACRTIDLCAQEYMVDGVKRDRLVWQGDLHPELHSWLALYDDPAILRESMDFVLAHTPPDGFMNGIASYSLWWIICQHDLYLRSGDLNYLRSQYDALRDLVGRMSGYVGSDGNETLPGFRFVDWPTSRDEAAVHAGLQALMRLAFHRAASLLVWLGDETGAANCRAVETRLASASVQIPPRKTAAALLALSGVVAASEVHAQVLQKEPLRDLSTFGGYYVLNAMALAGDEPGALELVRRYWGGMLDLGATTFWEDFELEWLKNASRIDEMPQPGKVDVHLTYGRFCYQGLRHSLCHGWASGPVSFLPEMLSGFSILEPGCRRVKLSPRLAGLEWFSCRIPTPFGAISVEMSRDGKRAIKLPPEITLSE